ncbi:hypothetical protein, partial [Nocardioides pelophilus]|uniref:hypothetical protein n=1 Tax=Nocardioides pelophilus TaxID=2172019 RepID=UPI001FECC719
MVSGMAAAAGRRQPDVVRDVGFNPVGQVVGQLARVERTSVVVERWVQEYVDACGRLEELNAGA